MESIVADPIAEKLVAILCQHLRFNNDKFPMETNLEDLGLDSMSAVNLLLDLEDSFGISFPDELLSEETFRTASTLHSALQSLLGDGGF